uniref:ATP synthase complex subunit 8 n=1 Tax=Eusthenes cupreus TaxID=1392985 RepID=T1QDQ1_9HEMI|nr:ATP synthase F0 subunit 8 [Eusthenes cupreus]AFY16809.1 ATP synthase F0 subunit 8 [Eusthenes cupreus]
MPQMAPLWWESLFLSFIILFIISSMIIYHIPKYSKLDAKSVSENINQMNWKW